MDYELEENVVEKKSQTRGSSEQHSPLSILSYTLSQISTKKA